MNILIMTESFASGVLQVLKDQCDFLANKGYSLTIVYSRRRETPTLSEIRSLFPKNTNLIEVPSCRELSIKKDMKTLWQYMKIIRHVNPHIIHLHSTKAGALGRIASFVCKGKKQKVFYTPHGFSFIQSNLKPWKQKLYFFIEKLLALLPGKIIAVSQSECNDASHLKKHTTSYLIKNGINNKEIEYILSLKPIFNIPNFTDKFIIGTSGRLSPQKNPEELCKLTKALTTVIPNVQFIWIGDGELRTNVEKILIEEGLINHFFVTGWLSRKEAINVLHSFRIYIHLSKWDGLSISLLEAMYLQKPVIVSNIPGNKDAICNDDNGLIVNSLEEAFAATVKLCKNTEMCRYLGGNAKKTIEKEHITEKNLDSLLRLYHDDE